MPLDLSTLTLGQLEAMTAVLAVAVAAGERAEAEGVAISASIELDEEFATMAPSWPCEAKA